MEKSIKVLGMPLILLCCFAVLSSCTNNNSTNSEVPPSNEGFLSGSASVNGNSENLVLPEDEGDVLVPTEIKELLDSYYTHYQEGVAESVKLMYFSDAQMKQAYVDSNDYLIDYKLENIEKINEKLYAVTVNCKTMYSMILIPDEFEKVYNFIAYIQGNWVYINNISQIPMELQENLNPEKYVYDNHFIIEADDIIFE